MNLKNKQKNKIPDGWEVKKLGEISKIKMGQSPLSEFYNEFKKGFPLIQGNADLKNNKTIERIFTTQETKIANFKDIILTVRAPVGALGIVEQKKVCIGRGVCSVKNNEKSDQNFIYYFLDNFKNKWKKYEQGSTFSAVNSFDVRNLKVVFPPLPEQKRIVSVLGVWDEEIERLERKIGVKENIKKGLLQKMLSCELLIVNGKKVYAPKLRLPGFDGEWEEKKLGDVCEVYQPKTISKTEMSEFGKHKVFGANGVIGYYDRYNHEKSEIAITCRGATCGTVNFTEPKSWITGNAMVVSPLKDKKIEKCFLLYYLNFINLDNIITGMAQPQITGKDLKPFKIKTPTIKEQKAIAEVLTTADEEIEMLRRKLEILKDQKKFLLNNLVTGKIRVPE